MDARNTDEKQKVSWTHALRQIVINCYKYHGREDLLPVFNEEEAEAAQNNVSGGPSSAAQPLRDTERDKKPTIIQNVVTSNANNTSVVIFQIPIDIDEKEFYKFFISSIRLDNILQQRLCRP